MSFRRSNSSKARQVWWAAFRLHVDHHGRFEDGPSSDCRFCQLAGMVPVGVAAA